MKKIMIAAAALVAMTACNKTLIENPVADSDYGYINLGITADTEMGIATKTSVNAPGTYRVKLEYMESESWTNKWNNLAQGNGVLGDGWVSYSYLTSHNSDLLTVPVGTYKFTVENIAESSIYDGHANGQMYVKGESGEITVVAGKSVSGSVACTVKNSKVIVKMGTGFDTYFKEAEIQVIAKKSSSDQEATTFNMNWTEDAVAQEETTKYNEVFLPAGTSVVWKLTAVRKDNVNSTAKYTYTNEGKNDSAISTVAGKCTVITLTPSTNGDGAINVTITTDESYDNNEQNVMIDPIEGETVS